MKLRTKVFFSFTTLAIIPLVIITVFAYSIYVHNTHQRMDEISSTLFENALENTNNTLENLKQAAGLFTFYSDSNFSIIQNLDNFSNSTKGYDNYEVFKANQNIKFVCQNILYSYNYIYGLYVFTPSGAVLGNTAGKNGDIKLGFDPSNDKWYNDTLALNGGLYVSSVDKHSMFTGKKDSIFFAQSLYDVYTHKFLGVLVIDCNPNLFDLELLNTMPNITLLTLDNTDTNCVLYTNIDNLQKNFARTNKQVLKKSLDVAPLELTAVFDYDTLFRDFNVTGFILIFLSIFCALGIILLTYLVTKNLVYPIEHLSRKMATQKGHSLSTTSKYLNNIDEIGTLYNEYNSMVEKLHTSIKKDYQDKLVILDAQMKSLEARINSHFLFNTLESINSMAELDDNEQIATMSLALGNMFRYTIKTQSELVSVEEELKHVEDYVSIQSIRFGNKFKFLVDMDDSFRQYKVLKLILQPLVENSLFHGLNYCTTGDTIKITGRRQDNILFITVEDNGQGMDEQQMHLINAKLQEEASFTELGHRKKQSIGLKNIHSRIALYYGSCYGLSIRSCVNKGTTIEIKLPLTKKENT